MDKSKSGNVLNKIFNNFTSGTKTKINPVTTTPREFIANQNVTSFQSNRPIPQPSGVDDILEMFEDNKSTISTTSKMKTLDSDIESRNDKVQKKSGIRKINLNFKNKDK